MIQTFLRGLNGGAHEKGDFDEEKKSEDYGDIVIPCKLTRRSMFIKYIP